MLLLDSNIIIYATQPPYDDLRRMIAESLPFVSAVSYVEVLGYHKLQPLLKRYFPCFLSSLFLLRCLTKQFD
jgi:hypothetical protein